MKTSDVLLAASLCGILLIVSTTDGLSQFECEDRDFLTIQKACTKENAEMLAATSDAMHHAQHGDNDPVLCNALFELWVCVAGTVPKCFHSFTQMYNSYFHSPHNCHQLINDTLIQHLQELTKKTAAEHGDGDVNVEVYDETIVPLWSSTFEPDPSSGTVNDSGGGEAHEHSGNGSRKTLAPSPVFLAVVISWLVTSRPLLTSVLDA